VDGSGLRGWVASGDEAHHRKLTETMPWGRRTAFIADPEGNIHEVYSLREEDV